LKAQEQAVPICCKTNQQRRPPAWLNREHLLGLRKKRRVYHLWKTGQATQEKYRGLVTLCRVEIRKAKAQLELRLATVVRGNQKCFYKYFNNKKRAKENLHPLLDTRGNIVNKDEEKAEVLNACFASVFNSQSGYSQGIQPPVLEDRQGVRNETPIIQEEAVNDLLCHLDQNENPGNYRPVNLTSVPGKIMERFILSALSGCVKDNQGIRPSQHGFVKSRSCLTNLISFYDQVTCLLDEGKAVDVIYVDFHKAFDTVPHSILLEKLTAHALDGSTLC